MASIKKNFFYNIIINVSAVIYPLITAPYIARVLEPDGVGLMNFANTYASYYIIFALLGASTYGIREFAKRRDNHETKQQFFSELFTILCLNTVAVSLVFLITLFSFPRFNSNFIIFFIAGFAIFLSPFQITNSYLGGHELFGISASRNIVIRTLTIVCMFIFVKTKSDLYIYMLLAVISNIGSIIWNFTFIKKDHIKVKFSFKSLGAHYKPMLILFSSSIAISIYTMLDSLMLGFMKDYNEVGFYNGSANIAKTALSIVTSLSAVAVPRVAYYFEKKDINAINDLLSKSFSIVAFMVIPMSIGLACIAKPFVPLFLGKEFIPAIMPLIIMCGIIIAIGFNNITGMQTLLGMGYDKPYLYCLLVGTFLNLFLNLALIPKLGAVGASISSVCAEFAILTAMLICIRRLTPLRFAGIPKELCKSIIASVPFIPITFFFDSILSGWLLVVMDVFSCIIIYFLIQKLLKSSGYSMVFSVTGRFLNRKNKSATLG